ncbi:hypothetical protein MMC07_001790 [Pseudocyphellaria aurata]|nr:hypothetical protein [Pseudocyphellaria aurata]
MDEMEEDFVVLGNEASARWDGDEIRYVQSSLLQSVVSTARYSWNNLSLSSVQSRLDAIGAAAAEKLVTAVTGLRPQAAGGIPLPVPKALMTPVDNFVGKIDDGERVHNWGSNEEAKIGTHYTSNKGHKGEHAETEPKIFDGHDRSPREHDIRLQEDTGPRFLVDEQEYESSGWSTAWHRDIKQVDLKQRKQKLLAQWQSKEEKGAHQKHLNESDARLLISAPRMRPYFTRKNEETGRRAQTPGSAHTAVHREEKGPSYTAGMQRDARVTISLPSSSQITVQRSSSERRAGSSAFYGLSAQLTAPSRTHKDNVDLEVLDLKVSDHH